MCNPNSAIRNLISAATLAASVTAAGAKPYVPADSNEVLEVLPQDLLASRDELASMRRLLAEDPTDKDFARHAATRYLEIGKQEGDPRYYGYAQAAIAPWWDDAHAPPDILRVRAKLKERNHQYDDALVDLRKLIELEPHDVQAWIELANIYLVQGKFPEVRQACDKLREFAGADPAIMCTVPLDAVTGRAEEAYAALTDMLPRARKLFPAAVQWILVSQAEISQSLGRSEQAEEHYREGLANDPRDFYLLRAYADFLLDRGREDEVLLLLRPHTADTGILLLAALAAHRCGEVELVAESRAQLKSRFEETRLRGDLPHGKFESRYELELMNNPQRALEVAVANWKLQKAPRDSRNLLEASLAAKDPAAARSVVKFLRDNRTQDVELHKLIRQLERN